MAVIGTILVLLALGVFLWAAVGFAAPHRVKLSGRGQAVKLWAVSIAMLVLGSIIMPEPPPPTEAELAERRAAAEAREDARADPEPEPASPQAVAAPRSQVSGVTFREINDMFGTGSSLTELQKDRQWDATYEGLCVEWRGELVSLSEGLFSGFSAQFKHLPTTFVTDVVMSAPNSAEDELLTWSIGTSYTYRARLDSYGGAILPISVSMGCDP